MSEPFVGEIRMFAGNFAPRGWAFCDGQLLATSQNDALFSLLGTIYGGDGRTTFGLPDLRGRVPIHAGDGPGLSSRRLGKKAGVEKVTLTTEQMAAHNHAWECSTETGQNDSPVGAGLATGVPDIYAQSAGNSMRQSMISATGGSRSHSNLMPFLCIHFIIALFGIFPSRQ